MKDEGAQHIKDLFGTERYFVPRKDKPARMVSERAHLIGYFAKKANTEVGHIAFKLTSLTLPDLYYIKSAADAYEREGRGSWSKAFWGMLRTDKI